MTPDQWKDSNVQRLCSEAMFWIKDLEGPLSWSALQSLKLLSVTVDAAIARIDECSPHGSTTAEPVTTGTRTPKAAQHFLGGASSCHSPNGDSVSKDGGRATRHTKDAAT